MRWKQGTLPCGTSIAGGSAGLHALRGQGCHCAEAPALAVEPGSACITRRMALGLALPLRYPLADVIFLIFTPPAASYTGCKAGRG